MFPIIIGLVSTDNSNCILKTFDALRFHVFDRLLIIIAPAFEMVDQRND
jgi:hypothetical protein